MNTTKAVPAPNTVFAASYLLLGVAALALVSAAGSVFALPEFSYRSDRLDGTGAGALAVLILILFAAFAVVFSMICVLLAYFTGRGSGTARTLTWVLGGLAVCFNIGLLVATVYRAVSWYQDLVRIVAGATLLLTLGAITLLALPVSHSYFGVVRAARRHWQSRPAPPPRPAGYGPWVGDQRPLPGYRLQSPPPPLQPPITAVPISPTTVIPPTAPQPAPPIPSANQQPLGGAAEPELPRENPPPTGTAQTGRPGR